MRFLQQDLDKFSYNIPTPSFSGKLKYLVYPTQERSHLKINVVDLFWLKCISLQEIYIFLISDTSGCNMGTVSMVSALGLE